MPNVKNHIFNQFIIDKYMTINFCFIDRIISWFLIQKTALIGFN